VAPKLDFWQFEGGLPDLQNYLSWIGVVFYILLFYPTIIKGNRTVSLIILILQIIFFTFYIYLFNMEIIINSSIVLVTFILTEFSAWANHKYVMHGFMWYFHADHHRKDHKSWFERNDLFLSFMQ
jgi:hypothetical protein